MVNRPPNPQLPSPSTGWPGPAQPRRAQDPDISIRKRALDVTYSLVDESNIKSMTKEMGRAVIGAGELIRSDLLTVADRILSVDGIVFVCQS